MWVNAYTVYYHLCRIEYAVGGRVNEGVGHFDTTPEIKKGTVTPHVAKSYFETYKINDHM